MQSKSIIRLVFPPRCPICAQILGKNEGQIHEKCKKSLIYVEEPRCLRCGKPVYSPVLEFCLDCSKKPAAFDGGIAVWVYTKEMADSIAVYKYHGKREYAQFYAAEVAARCGLWIKEHHVDCITAVPLNKKKQRMRGFNQAALVAKNVGRMLEIPVDNQLLLRSKFTTPQKELNPQQRMKNLQKAFGPGKHAGRYKNVLIFDDIYTTGSTMKICSMILKKCGVLKVWILSLCIGSDY